MFYIPYCQAVETKKIEFVLRCTAQIFCQKFFTFFLIENLNNELKCGHENEVRVGDGKLKLNFARPIR